MRKTAAQFQLISDSRLDGTPYRKVGAGMSDQMRNDTELAITKQIAKVYGFVPFRQGGYKCVRCGKWYKDNYSGDHINERMINHWCKQSIKGSVSSSR